MVKPGIRRLAINRTKEINIEKRRKLNLLLLRQSYLTTKIQQGVQGKLGELRFVQEEIQQWYEAESKKIVLQSRVDDILQSEKVRIFHHEQHKKQMKKSAILKLETKKGLLVGHTNCAEYLEKELANLLLNPADLDPAAQAVLLRDVTPVFSDADNVFKHM